MKMEVSETMLHHVRRVVELLSSRFEQNWEVENEFASLMEEADRHTRYGECDCGAKLWAYATECEACQEESWQEQDRADKEEGVKKAAFNAAFQGPPAPRRSRRRDKRRRPK